jgi:hypothetical protein
MLGEQTDKDPTREQYTKLATFLKKGKEGGGHFLNYGHLQTDRLMCVPRYSRHCFRKWKDL